MKEKGNVKHEMQGLRRSIPSAQLLLQLRPSGLDQNCRDQNDALDRIVDQRIHFEGYNDFVNYRITHGAEQYADHPALAA